MSLSREALNALSGPLPWVEQAHPRRLKIERVARDDRHPVDEGGRCDQGIALAAFVGNMQPGAAQSHSRIDGQNSVFEFRQDMAP